MTVLCRWSTALARTLARAALLLATAASADPVATLQARMQLFHDGALRGFALAEMPPSGVAPYTEADFKALVATGANVVRVPISLRKCETCDHYDAPTQAVAYVQWVLGQAAQHGVRVIVTLLPTPGFSRSDYWDSPALQADIVRHWGRIATQLRAYPALQAYDLINEPLVPASARVRDAPAAWHALALAIALELRRVDPHTPLMVEPTPWGLPGSFRSMLPLAMPGVVYSFHFYDPHPFTHQGLPGYTETQAYPGQGWDSARLSSMLEAARRFAARQRAPMFIGEFSCVRWAPEGSCPRYLADAVALFEAERWGWTYHCWRCYQGWDPEIPPELPMAQRSGRLPEHRRGDTPTLLLLKAAMQHNRRH
jgi:hypothetical protein